MAAAARCIRSLSRSTATVKLLSSHIARSTSQKSGVSTSSPLIRSFLSTETGLLKGTRTAGLSGRVNFSKRFAPAAFACTIPKVCPLSVETCGEVTDGVDGNVGDDDGDTWSQGEEEPYLHIT